MSRNKQGIGYFIVTPDLPDHGKGELAQIIHSSIASHTNEGEDRVIIGSLDELIHANWDGIRSVQVIYVAENTLKALEEIIPLCSSEINFFEPRLFNGGNTKEFCQDLRIGEMDPITGAEIHW